MCFTYKMSLLYSKKKLQWEKRVDEQLKIKNTQVASDIMRDYLGFNEVQIQERINHVSKRSNSLNIDVSNLKTKNIHTHLKKQNEKNNITKNEVVE